MAAGASRSECWPWPGCGQIPFSASAVLMGNKGSGMLALEANLQLIHIKDFVVVLAAVLISLAKSAVNS